jgi:hypothetical protein
MTKVIQLKIVKFVQELLLDEVDRSAITISLINKKIDMVLLMNPIWGDGLDREWVVEELIRRNSHWIGQDTTLKSKDKPEPWLNSVRKKDWRYWHRYREWLERDLSLIAVDALDSSTDKVLELLEDPLRLGSWDRRGLVVGHVQSGKTGNYTGLICKAADAGYKIIIVLAGLHNNLRSQTQIRLEEGFLGYENSLVNGDVSVLGVGEYDYEFSSRPNCATYRSNNGDFSKKRLPAISPEERPWLFVVKKNKTVLVALLQWIQNHAADTTLPIDKEGVSNIDELLPLVKKIVTKLPVLIIDDEADHASVDTGERVVDGDGNADEEHKPTTINKLIRRILHSFSRSAYVGYTATPFANIFIHEKGKTTADGPDLFPSSFIHNLAAANNYIGPARIFGQLSIEGRTGGLDLIREICDHKTEDGLGGWMPEKHRNGYRPLYNGEDTLPPSLVEALDAFVLACAARRVRGQEQEHASMLVHVTRFNSVQEVVYKQVHEYIRHLRQKITRQIDCELIYVRFEKLWNTDFLPTSASVRLVQPDQSPLSPSWVEILAALPDSIADIEVRMINGTAKDVLDYASHKGIGLKVIAIGGDKLARGLTLEGLCISYFLRASKMYDTLMQMGRWFGYRPGYLDLCRLYTTSELIEWFGHITDAAEELREEFEVMAASGATPKEYGLKVQSHSVLMVTSRLKMRSAKNLMLSFSGQLLETVSLYREPAELKINVLSITQLIKNMGSPNEIDPIRMRDGKVDKWNGYLWSKVPAMLVVDFLISYKTHPAAYKVNSSMLAEFIESMGRIGEVTEWTVALIGVGKKDTDRTEYQFTSDIKIHMNKRSADKHIHDRYSIGRLLDPKDEAIDLDEAEWKAALEITREAKKPDPARMQDLKIPELPNGPAIRKVRGFGHNGVRGHPEKGVLLIYALDPEKSEITLPNNIPVIAFGLSFPGSSSGIKVEYKVNNILWEQEYGSNE